MVRSVGIVSVSCSKTSEKLVHCIRRKRRELEGYHNWNGEVHESQGTNEAGLVIDGNAIECLLHRYELVDLEIVFSENHHA